MSNNKEKLVKSQPVDLFYVNVPGKYSAGNEYKVIPAGEVEPDQTLETNYLSITILSFYAGDLPGEDDWDAKLRTGLSRIVPHFNWKAEEAMRRNEAFLKFRVAYWKESRKQHGHVMLDDGPYFADQAFQFVVDDYNRAGGFTDRQIFDSIRIRDSLILQIELQELDEFEKDLAPYVDVLKGTGLDTALRLSPQFSAIVPIASNIVRNISKLNKSDTVWDQEFTITTNNILGQSKLREGIYVILEALPEQTMDTKKKEALEIPFDPYKLRFKNNRLLYPGRDKKLKLWTQSYLVISVYRTPEVTLPFDDVILKYRKNLPDEFWDDYHTAMKGEGRQRA